MSNNSKFLLKIEWCGADLIGNVGGIQMTDDSYQHNLYNLTDYIIYKTTYTPIQGALGNTFLKYLLEDNYIEGNQITDLSIFTKDDIILSTFGFGCIKADERIDDDNIYPKNVYIVENVKSKIHQYLNEN